MAYKTQALRACMDGIGKTGSLDLGPNRDKLMQVVREIFVSVANLWLNFGGVWTWGYCIWKPETGCIGN